MKRIVKGGQIWKNSQTNALIKILEQTRFSHRMAFFHTMLLDTQGRYAEEEPDEVPEEYIVENWKLHRDVGGYRR